jgi:hypothetical protein
MKASGGNDGSRTRHYRAVERTERDVDSLFLSAATALTAAVAALGDRPLTAGDYAYLANAVAEALAPVYGTAPASGDLYATITANADRTALTEAAALAKPLADLLDRSAAGRAVFDEIERTI